MNEAGQVYADLAEFVPDADVERLRAAASALRDAEAERKLLEAKLFEVEQVENERLAALTRLA